MEEISTENHLSPTPPIKHQSRAKFVAFFVIASLLIVGGLWLTLTNFRSSQDNRQLAATGEPALSFDPISQNITINQDFTVKATLDAGGKQLTAAALKIKYDPSALSLLSVSNANGFPVELKSPVIDESTGTIFYVLGVPATGFIFTGANPIADLKFKALKAGSTEISYDQELSAATELDNTASNVVLGYYPSQVTIADNSTAPPVTPPITPPATPPITPPITPPVTPPPVTPPPATITPDPTKPNITVSFLLQGLDKADIDVPMELTAIYTANGEKMQDVYPLVGKSNADKQVVATTFLSSLPLGFAGDVKILVKPTVALRKDIGTITIKADNNVYTLNYGDLVVPVGDFVRGLDANGRDQTNTLGLTDLTRVINEFKKANDVFVPAEGENKELDVDYNGIVTLRDLTYAKNNLDDVYLPGD